MRCKNSDFKGVYCQFLRTLETYTVSLRFFKKDIKKFQPVENKEKTSNLD